MRVKGRLKRVFAVVLAAAMTIQLAPAGASLLSGSTSSEYIAYADGGVIGTVTYEDDTRPFTDLDDLVSYVKKDMKGKTFTIDMEADWGNEQLIIENNSHCTLNMHGHMYNRGLTKYKNDGEVICIHDYARLTING